jgi:hypothetical protein
MINRFSIAVLAVIGFPAFSLAQDPAGKTKEANARKELQIALADTTAHNVITPKTLVIRDKKTAIQISEPILFATYGKANITSQRPYDIYLVDHYWVITGTLAKGYRGGTFLIIIDATNSKIIRLTHGK